MMHFHLNSFNLYINICITFIFWIFSERMEVKMEIKLEVDVSSTLKEVKRAIHCIRLIILISQ